MTLMTTVAPASPTHAMFAQTVLFTSARVLQSHLELDYIFREILPGIQLTLDIAEAISASSVIYMEHDLDESIARYIVAQGKDLILFHLGDELGEKQRSAYQHARAVLRNYFHQHIFDDPLYRGQLVWVPNGYRNSVSNSNINAIKPAHHRKHLARFIGWLDNSASINGERVAFKDVAIKLTDLMHCIPMQQFGGSFSPHLYRALMDDSIFAPCPAGNAEETIRIFDALECGCIPITLRHTFLRTTAAMAHAPYLFLDNWSQLEFELKKITQIEQREALFDWQQQVVQHWQYVKEITRLNAQRIILTRQR